MALNYTVVTQSVDDLRDPSNSPSISLWPYLERTNQLHLMRTLSIYGESGKTRDQVRLYYMNAEALRIWREMGKEPMIIGEMRRPAKTAEMVFGIPYTE